MLGVRFTNIHFDWDVRKTEINIKKQGITFDETTSAFSDEISVTVTDPDHSLNGERAVLFGVSASNRHLVVSFLEHSDVIRIISAREMTPQERRAYEL